MTDYNDIQVTHDEYVTTAIAGIVCSVLGLFTTVGVALMVVTT